MILAKVIGNIVATRKDDTLVGYKLMVIRRINASGGYIESEEIAADYAGSGIGDVVLVGRGSSVRVDEDKKKAVIDMAIIGIVDSIDISCNLEKE